MGDFTNWEVYHELIETFGEEKVHAVKGNMDALDAQLPGILPESKNLTLANQEILEVHTQC